MIFDAKDEARTLRTLSPEFKHLPKPPELPPETSCIALSLFLSPPPSPPPSLPPSLRPSLPPSLPPLFFEGGDGTYIEVAAAGGV